MKNNLCNKEFVMCFSFCVCAFCYNVYFFYSKSSNHNKKHFVYQNTQQEKCNITFVSAYFKLDSKHDFDHYNKWLSNFFSNEMCLIFFHDGSDAIEKYSSDLLVFKKFILVDLESLALNFFNKTLDWWQQQTNLDPEIHIHKSYKLYWVWGLKTYFLNEAVSMNLFQSSVFFWIDAGCIRSDKFTNENWKHLSIPKPVLENDGIFMVNLNNFSPKQIRLNFDGVSEYDFSREDHIAGAIFGGQKNSMVKWKTAYLKTFDNYATFGRFAGKDQSVYASLCLENRGLCQFVIPDSNLYDVWFGMIPFITGTQKVDQKTKTVMISTFLSDSFNFYSMGAQKLISSIKRNLRRDLLVGVKVDYAVLQLDSKHIPGQICSDLEASGWEIVTVPSILPRDFEGTYWRFRDQFSKLNLWTFDFYDLVLYFDSDTYVLQDFSKLIQIGLHDETFLRSNIGATKDIRAGEWQSTFNMGSFMLVPNFKEAKRLVNLKNNPEVNFETPMAEQGFLNEIYGNAWYDFGFEYNANIAAYSQQREFWDKHFSNVSIIHYTMVKPWNCDEEYRNLCLLWN